MPNPYVVRVDRDAFWNQFRSTPEPALMMRRPPVLVEEPLFRARWPESGPYAGQSFPPFAHGDPPPPSPIQMPLPEGQFPNPPSDMPIEGLAGLGTVEVSVFSPLSVIAALASAWHGYKHNGDSPEWAAVWGVGSLGVTYFVTPMLWPVVPLLAVAQGYAKPTWRRTALFGRD